MLSQDDQRIIREATIAYRSHQHERAQRLIAGVLSRNPDSLEALKWATEFATTSAAQVTFLRRILAIDPNNRPARIQLDQTLKNLEDQYALTSLGKSTQPGAPAARKPFLIRLASVLGGGTLRLLPILVLVAAISGMFIYGYLYYQTNNIATPGPGFDTLKISAAFDDFKADDHEWKITYEGSGDSRYEGKVRYVVPIRIDSLRILTHDILVTSGDFADPALVKTGVSNHMFTWEPLTGTAPKGKINLIHAVPANQAIFDALLAVRMNDRVLITGREVLSIDVYDPGNVFNGFWRDSGCNTLLVKSVTRLDQPTPTPEKP